MPRPRRDRLIAMVVPAAAAVLAASACSSSGRSGFGEGVVSVAPSPTSTTAAPGNPTAPAPAPAPAVWAPCSSDSGPRGYQCATIRVPLDYHNPKAGSLTVAIDRRPATGVKIGSLLVNPGGPGASGVDFLDAAVKMLSASVRAHFDIVGFDPRGVAHSSPVTCADGPALDQYLHLDPAPTTDAAWQVLVAASKAFDQGCQARSGSELPFVGTENAAQDLDQIRQALGDSKLTYLGFSYATLLGATYAELFPTEVRAMALDGALDPAADPVANNIAQSAGFDRELNAFFADCAARPQCAWKPGGDLHAAFDALMARIRVRPLPGIGARTVGPDEALYGVLLPLYDRATWPDLGAALTLAGRGNGALLLNYFDLYMERSPDGTYGNVQAANNAVSCLDSQWPTDPEVLRRDAAAAASSAPEFGVANLYGGLTCVFWPVPATRHPHAIRASGSPPIVVVGSTGDPATPYPQAQALAAELEHGVLITRVGDGHTGYRSSACVRRAVDAYLVDLTVPAAATSCPSA